MAKKWITTNHSSPLDFALASGGSQIVEPGESAHIAIADPDSPNNQGMRHAGLYIMTDTKLEKDSVAVEPATTTRPSTT